MGWLVILVFGALLALALWRFARPERVQLMLAATAILFALAGYTWQGSPTLAGSPRHSAEGSEPIPDTDFAQTREAMLGRFDMASYWLRMADAYERLGDSYGAAQIVQAGVRKHPDNADLWIGYGNALVVHADGLMTPAAEMAFHRAAVLAPDHPAPKFFYGLGLAQGGRFDEAERIWLDILVHSPPDASWRPMVEDRLRMIERMKAAAAASAGRAPPRMPGGAPAQ